MATHFYNFLPYLDPETPEQYYKHPIHPISINQYGILFPDEGYEVSGPFLRVILREVGKNNGTGIGHKNKIIWECYNNLGCTGERVIPLDGNIINHLPENWTIVSALSRKDKKKAYDNAAEFLNNTVNYMKKVDSSLQKKGIDPAHYWKLLETPREILKVYNKAKGVTLTPEKKYNKNGEKIYSLLEQGKNVNQISLELGMNKGTIKYWVQKRKSELDI